MIGLFLWLILGSLVAVYVFVLWKNRTWLARMQWCGLVSLPLVAYFWDLLVIYFQHRHACATDGGLRVFIPVEKSDRIQIGRMMDDVVRSYFNVFYPATKMIEAGDGTMTRDGTKENCFLYTVDPATESNPKTQFDFQPRFKLVKTPIQPSVDSVFVLREVNAARPHGSKVQTLLERGGRAYAQWTTYRSVWNAGGVLPHSLQCHTRSADGEAPSQALIGLLTK